MGPSTFAAPELQPEPGPVPRPAWSEATTTHLRVAHIDLDYVYDPDPDQTRRNLDLLKKRVVDLGVNTVFLQAYADPVGDGLVRSLYFPNRHLPMRADLFKPVAEALRTAANVQIFAWMPVLSFDLPAELPRVLSQLPDGTRKTGEAQYLRLSPFSPHVRQAIEDIYEDLARQASLDGILFHDDALLTDDEDFADEALETYRVHRLPPFLQTLRADPHLKQQWTRLKTRTLTQLTLQLRNRVEAVTGSRVKTARNLFARPVLDPESSHWFSQDLDDFLKHYDFTAVMAMPLMEGVDADASSAWIATLVDVIAQRPNGLTHTVFELQTKDWSIPGTPAVDSHLFEQWLNVLQEKGVWHFGYYPDDFHQNQPRLESVRTFMRSPDIVSGP